jgi:hypothetical protein
MRFAMLTASYVYYASFALTRKRDWKRKRKKSNRQKPFSRGEKD